MKPSALLFFLCFLSVVSCKNKGVTICNKRIESSQSVVFRNMNIEDRVSRNHAIIYPPVPKGCTFRGRWHISNLNDSTFNVYVMMFDCDGTYYATEDGVTIRLHKEGNRFYRSNGKEVSDDYFEVIGGKLRLGDKESGDYTDRYGYYIISY